MIELIFIIETNKQNNSDYMYIKSTLDYYYGQRVCGITPIYAKTKTELTKQDSKIKKAIEQCKKSQRTPIPIIVADYDREEFSNEVIINYCQKNNYDLIWMNTTIEDVYLKIKLKRSQDKHKYAQSFMQKKDKLLKELNNLSELEPLNHPQSSNILLIIDKYITRK